MENGNFMFITLIVSVENNIPLEQFIVKLAKTVSLAVCP